MPSEHIDAVVGDLVIGLAESDERREAEAHMATCEACRQRLAAAEAACADIALALPPVAPGGSLRARLLASVDELERFTPMAPRLAELIDVSPNEARLALHVLSRPEEMRPFGLPGARACRLTPGPRRPATTAMLFYLEPGAGLPRHRHFGEETVLVFQGAFMDDGGRVVRAGEELYSPAGSTHAIPRVLGGEPCLCAIVNELGLEVVP